MKKLLTLLLALCMLTSCAFAETPPAETVIVLSDEGVTVNGEPIPEDEAAPVYLDRIVECHADVPAELAQVENRVVTITEGGVYRVSGKATDAQIAVHAPDTADVRLILDGLDLTCRTHAAIAVYSARDPRTAGEYGVTIELAQGSENLITGSHNKAPEDENGNELGPEFDGAIGSQVSLGFEGTGRLTIEADNEGVEVASGHMTINGGVFRITAGDDPLNVSEDGVGVLTVNDGYLYSAVRNMPGGEGDGIDSNGWIVFNGGTSINLAHPTSQDSGIDSDMGSSINGGVVVGAGNMYDPIESTSAQLFMMLEFTEKTDDLVVVTDAAGNPVFAYDFPYDYTYIAFSTPDLKEGETYHVYLGGEIEGEVTDGLYTAITAYTPGRQMMHGGGVAQQGGRGFGRRSDGQRPEWPEGMETPPEKPEGTPPDWQENMEEPPELPEGAGDPDAATGATPRERPEGWEFRGGFGGPRGMTSSADDATTQFVLTRESTAFSNVSAADANAE